MTHEGQSGQATGAILWFTGMPSAGKSTLAHEVGAVVARARRVEVLDGDEVRLHLSYGLGYSKADRDTNVRRIGFVARLLARHGVFVITATISPYAGVRAELRELARHEHIPFVEVFVSADLGTLVRRDVKGLYKRAIAGEIEHFTGVSDPYEPPDHPEVVVHTNVESVAESVERIVQALRDGGLIEP